MNKAAVVVGHPVPFVMGGDTEPILEAMLETGTTYVICPSETNQQKFMEKISSRPDVMVRINMDQSIITCGDLEAVYREADRVMDLARDREKACVGTGCLPYETEPEVVIKTLKYILSK